MFAFHRAATALLFSAAFCTAASQKASDALNRDFQSAVAHYNSGQYAAAQQELEALSRALPDSFEVQELLGLVYSAQGHEDKASTPFGQAVRLRPDSGPARNNLATNLLHLGKPELAEKEFKKVASYKVGSDTYAYPIAAGKGLYAKDKDAVTLWAVQ